MDPNKKRNQKKQQKQQLAKATDVEFVLTLPAGARQEYMQCLDSRTNSVVVVECWMEYVSKCNSTNCTVQSRPQCVH
jgi:hypothetical protein